MKGEEYRGRKSKPVIHINKLWKIRKNIKKIGRHVTEPGTSRVRIMFYTRGGKDTAL